MAFDILDGIRVDAGEALCLDDRRRLAGDARREIAGLLATVIIDGGAFDHRMDDVAVGDRIRQPPQNDHPNAAAEDRAGGAVVEGAAVTVGREDFAVVENVAATVRQLDRHSASQRHIAFAAEQTLASVVHGDQRGRACGLHIHARAI